MYNKLVTTTYCVLFISVFMISSTLAENITCSTYCAKAAVLTPGVGASGSVNETAYYFYNNTYLPGVYLPATNSSSNNCALQYTFSGTPFNYLSITGPVYAIDGSDAGFFLNLQLQIATTYEPMLELQPNQYKENGGTVDPTQFTYWQLSYGSLSGFGAYADSILILSDNNHSLMVGTGANGKNLNFGSSGWLFFSQNGGYYHTDINVDLVCSSSDNPAPTSTPTPTPVPTTVPTAVPTTVPTSIPTAVPTSSPDATSTTTSSTTGSDSTSPVTTGATSSGSSGSSTGSDYQCPPNPFVIRDAQADEYGVTNAGFAFMFNDTTTNMQYRYSFANDSGRLSKYADGSVSFSGYMSPQDVSSTGLFNYDILFEFHFIAGSTPTTYPKVLNASAYVPNGPVNSTTWSFYQFDYGHFQLTDSSYSLGVVPYMQMQLQVGSGANGKNINQGAAMSLVYYLTDANNVAASIGIADLDFDLLCIAAPDTGLTSLSSTGSSSGSSGSSGTSGLETIVTPAPAPSSPTNSATVTAVSSWVLLLVLFVAVVNL
eukprot:TRINITY_DN527_c0_g1_i1.p1 TRINITY_DN527_c0_g1~~TRINITY_DN527_c0_g1_i1.p1  ORF type:complete len:543 (+),score=141.74 TRINITY_DN527_c0_g1_i1:113-1741(+)